MHVRVALLAGVALIAAALAWTLSRTPAVVARSSFAYTHKAIAATTTPAGACQQSETMPRGTSAVRLGLVAVVGPRITVKVRTSSHVVATGTRAAGWEGGSVTVPIHPAARRTTAVTVCFALTALNGPVQMLGIHTHHSRAIGTGGQRLPGRLHLEYLQPGQASWWSMALATARRLGLGRAASGTWNAALVVVLAMTLIALSSWLLTRELGR